MKRSRVYRFFSRGALFSAYLLALAAADRPALAVETSGYAFGWDNVNSYEFLPHDASGLTTAVSSAFTPFPQPTGHAQSWASAKLVGNSLVKTTGGYGWVDGVNPSEYFVWSSFASGTELMVTGAPVGTPVSFSLVLPAINDGPDNLRPATLPDPPFPVGDQPAQLFFTESAGRDAAFFDVSVSLDASVTQKGTLGDVDISLFSGDATLQRDGSLQTRGSFAAVEIDDVAGVPSGKAILTEFRTPTFQVEAGVPFDLVMDLRMTMGDPDALIDPATQAADQQIFTQYMGTNFDQLAFGGGSFVVRLEMEPGAGNLTLTVVPEPGSLGLALAGLIALAGFVRRRRRRRVGYALA